MKFDNLNVELLQDSIKWQNQSWNFKDIEHIYCSADVTNYNLLASVRYLEFFFSFRQDEKERIIQVFSDIGIPGRSLVFLERPFWGLNKKQFESLLRLYYELSKLTYNSRLLIYKNKLRVEGFINYASFTLYNDGQLRKKDKLILNLKSEFDQNKVALGYTSSGFHSNTNDNSTLIVGGSFGIKLLGTLVGPKLKIDTSLDKDVICTLLENLMKTGSLLGGK